MPCRRSGIGVLHSPSWRSISKLHTTCASCKLVSSMLLLPLCGDSAAGQAPHFKYRIRFMLRDKSYMSHKPSFQWRISMRVQTTGIRLVLQLAASRGISSQPRPHASHMLHMDCCPVDSESLLEVVQALLFSAWASFAECHWLYCRACFGQVSLSTVAATSNLVIKTVCELVPFQVAVRLHLSVRLSLRRACCLGREWD